MPQRFLILSIIKGRIYPKYRYHITELNNSIIYIVKTIDYQLPYTTYLILQNKKMIQIYTSGKDNCKMSGSKFIYIDGGRRIIKESNSFWNSDTVFYPLLSHR